MLCPLSYVFRSLASSCHPGLCLAPVCGALGSCSCAAVGYQGGLATACRDRLHTGSGPLPRLSARWAWCGTAPALPLSGASAGGQGSRPAVWSGGGAFRCFERWLAVRWASGWQLAIMLAFLRWTFWWRSVVGGQGASSRSRAGCFLGFCTAGLDSALQQLSSFQNVSTSPAFSSFWSWRGGLPRCFNQDFGRSGLSGVCSACHHSTRAPLLLHFPGTARMVVVSGLRQAEVSAAWSVLR